MVERGNSPPGCEPVDVRINKQGDVRIFTASETPGDEWLPAVLTVEGWKVRGGQHAL